MNAVDLGEVIKVVKDKNGDWIEADFACGNKSKKKFADSRDEIFEKVAYKELSEDEVKKLITKDELDEIKNENCQYSHAGNGYSTWTAEINLDKRWLLKAYYEQPDEAFYREDGERIEDLGELDWEIDHYEIAEDRFF